MKNTYAVIMAGGIGSRFWPVSRTQRPKQFIDILGTGKSLIRCTYERFAREFSPENIFVVTNEIYTGMVKEQIPEIDNQQILGEPVGRNTAPCIAYACYKIMKRDPEARIVVAPSDHLILDNDLFFSSLKIAIQHAIQNNSLVTIGIKPNRPDTGYGYIQFIDDEYGGATKKVKTFTEKPALEMARTFIESGDFLWNAGIFIFRAKIMQEAFESYMPDLNLLFKEALSYFYTQNEKTEMITLYQKCSSQSIDYGIMEKASNVFVVPGDFGWSDLGTWNSLYDVSEKDSFGNASIGNKVHIFDSEGLVVNMPDDKLVVIKGAKNMIVVESDNILLICDKNKEQEVKQVVSEIKQKYGDIYI